MSLEEKYASILSAEISREIDKEILDTLMIDVLKSEGWIQTRVSPSVEDMGMLSGRFEEWYAKTAEWVHKNATGDYKLLKGQWLFKEPKDATMFILRWA
jgi:hypothetical protein